MIDIALRHEREMQRNDTQPYDKIMSDLTRESEDALDDKIDENKEISPSVNNLITFYNYKEE